MTIFSGLSETGKQSILDRHNDLRRRVAKGLETEGINPPQPPASDMRKLVWNDELEMIAQRLVDQCSYGHDDNRRTFDEQYVGQNIGLSWSTAQSPEATVQNYLFVRVQKWYDEVSTPGFNSSRVGLGYVSGTGTGHYTQIVWADTDEIGCGVTYYKEGERYNTYLACNYARAGNWKNTPIYTIGTACDDCPSGYTSCDDGLCAKP